jgi:hypothetical protein
MGNYRIVAIGLLNRWVLDGFTHEERQRRTDMTWRVMEELEADTLTPTNPGDRREARSPVGPEPSNYSPGKPFVCDCGHGWNHHDDYGCLWHLCSCRDMGERK